MAKVPIFARTSNEAGVVIGLREKTMTDLEQFCYLVIMQFQPQGW